MDYSQLAKSAIMAVVFTSIGLVMFGIAFKLIQWMAPFSIRKELEEDQNTSVGVLIGAIMLGLSIIIAAAIHG